MKNLRRDCSRHPVFLLISLFDFCLVSSFSGLDPLHMWFIVSSLHHLLIFLCSPPRFNERNISTKPSLSLRNIQRETRREKTVWALREEKNRAERNTQGDGVKECNRAMHVITLLISLTDWNQDEREMERVITVLHRHVFCYYCHYMVFHALISPTHPGTKGAQILTDTRAQVLLGTCIRATHI